MYTKIARVGTVRLVIRPSLDQFLNSETPSPSLSLKLDSGPPFLLTGVAPSETLDGIVRNGIFCAYDAKLALPLYRKSAWQTAERESTRGLRSGTHGLLV